MNWETVKLSEVITHRKGNITISDDKEYKLCRVQLHRKGVLLRGITKGSEIRTKKQQLCKGNDFIVAEMDAKFGGYGLIPEDLDGAIVSSHYYLFEVNEELLKRDFLSVLSKNLILQNQIKAIGSTNYSRVSPKDVLAWEIPLPSIQEQERIVQNIEIVEKNKNQISTELNHQLALVKELRQAYLREAMQGKLVPQDSTDEPAEILLEKIKAEKEKLVAEKRIKRDKPLPPIKPEEIPFEIPSNWTWCRLGEIVLFSEAGSSFKCVDRDVIQYEWGVVKTSSVTSGFFVEKENKFYSATEPKDISKQVNFGDFLFCRASGSRGLAGKSSIVEQISRNLLLSDKTIRFHFSQFIKSKLIWFYNNSMFGEDYYNSLNTGKSTTMNNVTRPQIYSMPFPLPPLAEQERIAAKLEKLMKFCDELEVSIKQGIANADSLLQVALKEALEPK